MVAARASHASAARASRAINPLTRFADGRQAHRKPRCYGELLVEESGIGLCDHGARGVVPRRLKQVEVGPSRAATVTRSGSSRGDGAIGRRVERHRKDRSASNEPPADGHAVGNPLTTVELTCDRSFRIGQFGRSAARSAIANCSRIGEALWRLDRVGTGARSGTRGEARLCTASPAAPLGSSQVWRRIAPSTRGPKCLHVLKRSSSRHCTTLRGPPVVSLRLVIALGCCLHGEFGWRAVVYVAITGGCRDTNTAYLYERIAGPRLKIFCNTNQDSVEPAMPTSAHR